MIKPASRVEQECVNYLQREFPPTLMDDDDKDFLTGNTYLRFARARDGNKEKASKMLREAITWRKTFKPYCVKSEDVKRAMKQMTMTCGGRCKANRPVLVMTIAVPNECSVDERVKQLVYILEVTQHKGYENITWIIDFSQMGKHERDPRSRETRKTTMKILQDYYPERLGLMLLYRLPWYASALATLVKPFLDSRTRAKIFKAGKTIEHLEQFIDKSQLPECLGGSLKSGGLENLENLPPFSYDGSNEIGSNKKVLKSPLLDGTQLVFDQKENLSILENKVKEE